MTPSPINPIFMPLPWEKCKITPTKEPCKSKFL
jgi:hypothetical protein